MTELDQILAILDAHGIAEKDGERHLTAPERVRILAEEAKRGWAFAGDLRAQRDMERDRAEGRSLANAAWALVDAVRRR